MYASMQMPRLERLVGHEILESQRDLRGHQSKSISFSSFPHNPPFISGCPFRLYLRVEFSPSVAPLLNHQLFWNTLGPLLS